MKGEKVGSKPAAAAKEKDDGSSRQKTIDALSRQPAKNLLQPQPRFPAAAHQPPTTSTSDSTTTTTPSTSSNWRTAPFTGEFRDPELERAFWRHLQRSGRLAQLDSLASAVLSFCLSTAVAIFGRQGMNPWPMAVAAAAMLLMHVAARGRWPVYERNRTLVASLARVAVVFATCSSAFLSLPLFSQAWGAAFLQGGGSRSSGAAHAAAVALAKRQAERGGGGGIGVGGGGNVPPPSALLPLSSQLSSSFSSSAFASTFYTSFGAGIPGHWVTAAANCPPWARHWFAFFTRTPRVQAMLLSSFLVMPLRAHALVSALCALTAVAVLGSTVAGREAYFGREKHVEVARFLSSLTRWLVRLPSFHAAAALSGGSGSRSGSGSGGSGNGSSPRLHHRGIAEDRATAAVMIVLQIFLGLLLPTHVMFAWQAKARRTFRDSEVAKRKRREEEEGEEEEERRRRGKGGGVEVGVGGVALRRPSHHRRPSSPSPSPTDPSSASARLMRSAGVDSALLAVGLQLSAVVCFWFVLEELDAWAGEKRLWFSLP